MVEVKVFVFNPFQENTIIVSEPSGQCLIFDPGCYQPGEKSELVYHIEKNNLRPVRLINTHCHLDHVFGNKFVAEKFDLLLEIHKEELSVLNAMPEVARVYGLPAPEKSPGPEKFLSHGDTIRFGNSILKVIHTPGHSPGGISFYCEEGNFVVVGDVLFQDSIGRTDLPGGDYETLISSIQEKLLILPAETVVYPGHGPATTIGREAAVNPFLTGNF